MKGICDGASDFARNDQGGPDWLARTRILLGDSAVERLARAKVYVFGLGAVGSYTVEGLARAGVGNFRLVDFDVIKESNLNRQLFATRRTLGMHKCRVAAERIADINPAAVVEQKDAFAHVETLPSLLAGFPDLIVDAVDSLAPKTEIIAAASLLGVPVFSALGAATRMDAGAVRFAPLFEATGCPLGRLLRKRLRKRLVDGDLWCVYSDERKNRDAVRQPGEEGDAYRRGRERNVLGSLSTITGIFGLRIAHEAVLRLSGKQALKVSPNDLDGTSDIL